MTPEQLETLVLNATNPQQLQEAFAGLTTCERKALSAFVQSLQKQIFKLTADADASKQLKKFIAAQKAIKPTFFSGTTNGRAVYSNVALALFALGPLSALKRQDIFIGHHHKEVFEQIVADRKPDWLDQWLAFDLERDLPRVQFSTLRRWIRNGICKKPSVDGYYRMFSLSLMSLNHGKNAPPKAPLSRQLLAEPDLLDDIWRLFEIENFAFINTNGLTNRAPADYETWPMALLKLSKEGHLDRQRLLDASLQGLHTDLKQNQLAGFHKFHELLAPDAAERLARQTDYITLLNHKIGHVVKFALGMLYQLEKDQQLDRVLFLSECHSIFFQEQKSNAITTLKLIKRIIKNQTALCGLGLNVVIEALRHADLDVQKTSLELLELHKAKLDDKLKADLHAMSAYIAQSLQSRLSCLAGEIEHDDDAQSQVDMHGQTAANLAIPVSNSTSVASGQAGFSYETLDANILNFSILPTVEQIIPIKHVDELISAVSHAVEIVDSVDEVERILDGISRLCGNKSPDFHEKTAPLLHRLEKHQGLITINGIAGAAGVRLTLADLILSWLTGRLYHSSNPHYFSALDAAEPSLMRLRNLTSRIVQGKTQPLLAAPTHSGGWINPLVWINRLSDGEANQLKFDQIDICLSLLRLAPDHRQQALEHLCTNRVPIKSAQNRRLAEFVLGGNVSLKNADRDNYDLWISAARARDPYADWSEFLAPLQLDDSWPDSVRPVRYQWWAYFENHSKEYNFGDNKTVKQWQTPRLDIEASIASPTEKGEPTNGLFGAISKALDFRLSTDWKLLPSVALNYRQPTKYYWSADLNSKWIPEWLVYQWPLKPDGLYLTAAMELISRIDADSSGLQPCAGFFQGLFQAYRPWHEPAHLLVCAGLNCKDADARGLAIDALIWAIDNQIADIQILAETFTGISKGGLLKLKRLGDNLLQVSQVSALHAWVVSEVIQLWLPNANTKQQNFYRILEVLLEAQSISGQGLNPQGLAAVRQIKSGGKVAKLTAELLKLANT